MWKIYALAPGQNPLAALLVDLHGALHIVDQGVPDFETGAEAGDGRLLEAVLERQGQELQQRKL